MWVEDFKESCLTSWRATTRTLAHRGFDDGFWVVMGDLPIPQSSLRVPCDFRRENTVWLSLATLRAASSACAAAGCALPASRTEWAPMTSPAALAMGGALGCLHADAVLSTRRSKTLFQTAMSPHRVIEQGEYWRLITSQAYASSTTSFLTHISDLMDATRVVESAWGTWRALAGVVAAGVIGGLIHVGLAEFVNRYYPEVALAKQYFRYSTGLSITSIAARTMAGYVMDEEESKEASVPNGRVFRHRFSWAISVMLSNALLRLSAGYLAGEAGTDMRPYALLESPGFLEVASGVVAGMLLASSETDVAWQVTDLVLQGLALAGCAASYAGMDEF